MTRRLAPILVVLLALSACGSSGEPRALNEQPVPVGDDLGAALGTGPDTTLPVVERNFLEGCVIAETPRIVGAADLVASCRCTYSALVAFYTDFAENEGAVDVDAAAYDRFKELDRALQDETTLLPANIQSIIDGCAA